MKKYGRYQVSLEAVEAANRLGLHPDIVLTSVAELITEIYELRAALAAAPQIISEDT